MKLRAALSRRAGRPPLLMVAPKSDRRQRRVSYNCRQCLRVSLRRAVPFPLYLPPGLAGCSRERQGSSAGFVVLI
jgi:hypothetical protein